EYEALDGSGAEPVADVIVVTLAGEDIAARFRHRADYSSERTAILRLDAAGLDLHFLQVLEHGVLTRAPIDQTIGGHAVDGEHVLCTAGAVHLEAAFYLTSVHARRSQRDALKAAALRQPIDLFCRHVVRERDARQVELARGIRRDVDDFRQHAGLQPGIGDPRLAEKDEEMVADA